MHLEAVTLKHGYGEMPANMAASRYELKELLGEGGMGVVYRAFDTRTNSYVALKTLRDASDLATLEMFKHEWAELAKLSHPNIVDIRDVDEIEESGIRKPCFIMPLLPGVTLAALIKSASPRLTIEFVVSVISQVCKGLQAAHEKDLIHRDLKPSNIFIMDDDTAKIIDFGLVHAIGTKSVTGLKGTWQYMAPEQVEGKRPDRCTDIFALGIVAYEALTGQQPFKRSKLDDTVDAVKHFVPQAISEKNPKVSQLLSKAIHVAMAKQQNHRYASAREFAETLQKAYNNQYIERFDPVKIRPRIDRAKRAFSNGDSEFASEILTELEVEGNLDADITLLRSQLDEYTKQKRVRQLFEAAQTREEQGEIPLAIEKLHEILRIDPQHPEAQLMRRRIEDQRSQEQVSDWLKLAHQHLERNDFQQARDSLKEVFKLKYDDPDAAKLKAEVDAREKEVAKALFEKEHLYSSALRSQQTGEISSALTKLKKIFELSRNVPGASVPERDKVFQAFYNDVSTESDRIDNAYAEGTRHLNEKNFQKALQVCDGILAKYPKKPQFQALRLKVEHAERQELSAYIDEVLRAVDAEPNLDRRVGLLEQARTRYPNEAQFQRQFSHARDLRDLISSIVAKARTYEEQEQFGEAIAQWNTLANIHPQYPGVDFEISQLERRRERQAEDEKKARLVEKIDRALESSTYDEAERLSQEGLLEFPQNPELLALVRLARQGLERTREAHRLFEEAKAQKSSGAWDRALDLLRQALDLDKRNIVIQNTLVNLQVQQAHALLDTDWTAAEPLAAEAGRLDPEHQSVKKLISLIAQAKKKDYVERCVSRARELQEPDVKQAIEILKQALTLYPNENRLHQTLTSLEYQGNTTPAAGYAREDKFALDRALALDQTRAAVVSGRTPEEQPTVLYDGGPVLDKKPTDDAARPKTAPPQKDAPPPPWKTALAGVAGAFSRLFSGDARKANIYGALVGLAAAVLLIGIGYWYLNRKPAAVTVAPPPAVSVRVAIQPSPADAEVAIDGTPIFDRNPSFKQGSQHQVRVSRVGYKTVETSLEANGQPWSVALEPQPLHVSVSTSESIGTVWLDDRREGVLQGGEWSGDYPLKAAEEQHTLSVKNKTGVLLFNIRFKAAAGKPATVDPLETKDLLVASSLDKNGTLYTGNPTATLALSGKERQSIPAAGLPVNLDEAPDGFPISADNRPQTWRVAGTQAPALSISLNAAPNLSTISISSSEKNASLLIEGEKQRPKKPGFWSWTAASGTYKAKLTASGMTDEDFVLKVHKGEPINRKFQMTALAPSMATLVISGGTPGATVSVDGAAMGDLDDHGSLSQPGIQPGSHNVLLSKAGFGSRTFYGQNFVAGKTLVLPGDKTLSPQMGAVTFSVNPPAATIRYRRVGEQEWRAADTSTALRLSPSSYEFSVSAPKYKDMTVTEIVEADKVKPLSFVLSTDVITPPSPLLLNMDEAVMERDWLKGKQSKSWLVVRPGYPKNTLLFLKKPGPRHFMWTIRLDDQNSLNYSLDSHGVSVSKEIEGTKTTSSASIDASNPGGPESYAVVIYFDHGVTLKKRDGTVILSTPDDKHDWARARIAVKGDAYFSVWPGR
jgi:serine/threonine protein kinase